MSAGRRGQAHQRSGQGSGPGLPCGGQVEAVGHGACVGDGKGISDGLTSRTQLGLIGRQVDAIRLLLSP
ncbi:MAG: hypothetical protein WA996_23820 [Candidatus Promineifilaceae bacterium]